LPASFLSNNEQVTGQGRFVSRSSMSNIFQSELPAEMRIERACLVFSRLKCLIGYVWMMHMRLKCVCGQN
jgi:hypothetical protein